MWPRILLDSREPGASRLPARRGAARRRPAPSRPAVEALDPRIVPATLSVSGATVLEGKAGTQNALVTVSLSEPHPNNVTVNYSTADGTATAGSDYGAVSGKLTFAKGESSKTILVPVRGDLVVEPDEYFLVQLSKATKGTRIADGTGYVTILDDEPRISISDVSASEGNAGTAAFTFTVGLSVASDLPVTVNYATADGTATAGGDYAPVSGTLTFQPGQPTSQTVTVLVNGDRLSEENETFLVNLSTPNSYAEVSRSAGLGTIIDDELRINVGDAYNYGDSSPFIFTVTLSAPSDERVTVDFTTANGTALAGVDYVFTSGTLALEPGVTTMTIMVDVLDPTYADNKYFTVYLSNASTYTLVGNELATGSWYYDPGYYDPGYGYDYHYGWY